MTPFLQAEVIRVTTALVPSEKFTEPTISHKVGGVAVNKHILKSVLGDLHAFP